MKFHADALANEGDSFVLQAHLLLESRFAGKADPASGAEDTMPRESAHRTQRPYNLPRGAREPRSRGDLAVRRHLAFRNLQDDCVDLGEHAFRINDQSKR